MNYRLQLGSASKTCMRDLIQGLIFTIHSEPLFERYDIFGSRKVLIHTKRNEACLHDLRATNVVRTLLGPIPSCILSPMDWLTSSAAVTGALADVRSVHRLHKPYESGQAIREI